MKPRGKALLKITYISYSANSQILEYFFEQNQRKVVPRESLPVHICYIKQIYFRHFPEHQSHTRKISYLNWKTF
jgi:hypothetical protein